MKSTLIEVVYRALTILAFPLLLLYLALRVLRDHQYAHGLKERLGILPRAFHRTVPGAVWLHAVSVGEVLTAVPLVQQLQAVMPWAPLYVSVTTLAGRAMADQKLGPLASGIFFTPLDMSFAVRAVLRILKPALVVVMETEIWPNLYREVKRSGASLVVVNGRISDKAMPTYRRWSWFFRSTLRRPDAILAQDERAASRYRELGAQRVEAAGNLKYDFDPATTRIAPVVQALLELLHPATVLIAASTMPPEREGDRDEDDLVIYTILKLRGRFPRLLLIWAPRRPQRFDAAAQRLQVAGIPFLRRSQLSGDSSMELPGVLLVDTMGELAGLFRLGDAVFLGGTFPHRGGHNPLEPAAFGVPIVAGPHMENFAEIAADFDANDAWVRVEDPRELGGVLVQLLDDRERRSELGVKARALAAARRGATARAVIVLREAYENALPAPLAPLWQRLTLGPLSWVWRAGVWVDRAMKSRSSGRLCCVVSVGNLSVGGTGKTPFVIWLCARLKERGQTPGVLLRGYRRSSGPAVLTLAAGRMVPVEKAGEEALIHLRAGYGPVGVGADRARVLIELQARFGIDCAIADDGFQHWRLRRDCDIVLVDSLDPLGGGVLPLGRLREDFSALRRAHAVVVTRTIAGRTYTGLLRKIQHSNPGIPVFLSRIVADLESVPQGAGAFCALGNPESFRTTLSQLRVASGPSSEQAGPAALFQPAWFQVLPDHHRYSEAEIDGLLLRAPVLVTTEKDWLNLPARFQSDGRILVVPIRVAVERGSELVSLVRERLLGGAAQA